MLLSCRAGRSSLVSLRRAISQSSSRLLHSTHREQSLSAFNFMTSMQLPSATVSSAPTEEIDSDDEDACCARDYMHSRRRNRGSVLTSAVSFTEQSTPSFSSWSSSTPTPQFAASFSSSSFSSGSPSSSPTSSSASRSPYSQSGLKEKQPGGGAQPGSGQEAAGQETASFFAGTEDPEEDSCTAQHREAHRRRGEQLNMQPRCSPESQLSQLQAQRHQDAFDEDGRGVAEMSSAQSLRRMEREEQGAGAPAQPERERAEQERAVREDGRDEAEKRPGTPPAAPRPIDNRRPGDEVKDPAAPWSE